MAGAGYKLFNTGDVLTAAQVNTYLNEQTVMVFASSAARTSALSGVLAEGMMSYLQDTNAVEVYNGTSWVNVGNAGDITEVQAGVGISIASGTGPIPVVTNTVATAFDAAGDLVYGTGADTFTKLSLGTAGQVLKVNSGATAPEWGAAGGASGFTFITSASPSASAATNVNNCFTSTYDHYKIIYYLTATTTSNNRLALRMRASGSDLTSNYKNAGSYTNGADGAIGFNDLETTYIMIGQNDTGNPNMAYGVIDILRPQASDYTRLVINSSGFNGTTQYSYEFRTFVNNTTSYDGFTVYVPSGNVTGNFKVYGYSNS